MNSYKFNLYIKGVSIHSSMYPKCVTFRACHKLKKYSSVHKLSWQ